MINNLKHFARQNAVLFTAVRLMRRCIIAARWPLRSRFIRAYLKANQVSKLQLGAGHNLLDGWLNTDLYPRQRKILFLDATKKFPIDDCSFDYIFGEHQFEQLTYNQGLHMLRECFRILKPGGTLRIATPSLETVLALYTPEKSDVQQRYIRWVTECFIPDLGIYSEVFVINNSFRHYGHRFLYDQTTLEVALQQVGFTDVTRYNPGESNNKILREIEHHGEALGGIEHQIADISNEEMNRFETMVLEASRPLA